ncbi:putative RiPP precursor [Kaistia sp. 32K]|nr:putative RiPP precursor [Kaistia sp. 32K]
MTKKTYEAPALVKREKLDRIAAGAAGSRPVSPPPP